MRRAWASFALVAACGGAPADRASSPATVAAPVEPAAPAASTSATSEPPRPEPASPAPRESADACAPTGIPDAHGGCTACPPPRDLAHAPRLAPPDFGHPAVDGDAVRAPTALGNAGDPGATAYAAAYAKERAQRPAEARRAYFDLITKMPSSAFVPPAYLAFGELFFDEATGDPSKLPLAQAAYEKAVTSPPPGNRVYGYAWYKLGYVFARSGDSPRALAAFRKAIDHATMFSSLPGTADIAADARKQTIAVFALAGDPERAYAYLHPLSGDAAGSNAATFTMMRELGDVYLASGHFPEGMRLYRDLRTRDVAPEQACTYETRLREVDCALRASDADFVHRRCPDLVVAP